jgi:hypothetical protein
MSSGTAVGVLLSASRRVPRALAKNIGRKAPRSSTLALSDAGLQRKCGLIAQADNKGNEQQCALQEIR